MHQRDARTAENKDKIFVWNCKVRLKETMQIVVQDAIGNDHEAVAREHKYSGNMCERRHVFDTQRAKKTQNAWITKY